MPYKDKEAGLAYHRERNRKRYLENYEAERERLKANKVIRQATLQAAVDERKDFPCTDCGVKYPPVCMDFDHINDDKDDSIARMVGNGRALRVILSEIEKCELVCANCHRLRTQKRWRV